jgi:maltooligosyltrehalose synthase
MLLNETDFTFIKVSLFYPLLYSLCISSAYLFPVYNAQNASTYSGLLF